MIIIWDMLNNPNIFNGKNTENNFFCLLDYRMSYHNHPATIEYQNLFIAKGKR